VICGWGVGVLVAAGVPGVEEHADEVRTAAASPVARLKSSRWSGSSAVPRRTCRGGRWLRLGDGLVDLVHKNPPNRVSEMRKGERKGLGLEGGAGVSLVCQNPTRSVAEVSCCGEKFVQPGGSESRGEGKRTERGCWAL
jgi:hypothetical protein